MKRLPTRQRSSPSAAEPSVREARAREGRLSPVHVRGLALAGLAAMLAWNIRSIGLFGDDFHFLDAVRRAPLWDLLDGHAGIAPWYRPLSRETFFALVVGSGPAGLPLAHLLQALTAFGSAWQLRSIGSRLGNPLAGTVGAVLFLLSAMTQFLVSWASGFQDSLAMLLMLSAVAQQMSGRFRAAAALTFLALFAKESTVILFPLLAVVSLSQSPRPRLGRWLPLQLAVLVGAGSLHLWVRSTWAAHPTQVGEHSTLAAGLRAFVAVLGSFLGEPSALSTPAAIAALVGGSLAADALLGGERLDDSLAASSSRQSPGTRSQLKRHARAVLLGGVVLGGLPLLGGIVSRLLVPHAYYGYSMIPWLALGLGWGATRLPRPVLRAAVVGLAMWNAAAHHPRPVDLTLDSAWVFRQWDWKEAQRLSAVTGRLESDLRSLLPARSDSLTILISGMERGCYFQTEDGPATREALNSPTTRSYWMYEVPFGLAKDRYDILVFNPESRHLERHPIPVALRLQFATAALARGRPGAAWAFASYGDDRSNGTASLRYLRATATLLAGGTQAYASALRAEGLIDANGSPSEDWVARLVGRDGPLSVEMAAVIRQPLDGRAHLHLANALRASGNTASEAVELRAAIALDSNLTEAASRLADTLRELGSDTVEATDTDLVDPTRTR